MSQNDIVSTIENLLEWEKLIAEAKDEAEKLRQSLKSEMLRQGKEELICAPYIVRWTPVLSNRFDTTAFKEKYGDLYKEYTKQVSSLRFSIS